MTTFVHFLFIDSEYPSVL